MSEKARKMAKHSGMGAIPHAKGVTFRVWAPHAEKVYLIGTFNGWSETSIPLFNEKNGYWSTDVSEAKVGDEYRYLIHGPESSFSRIDPYARKVTNSKGNGIIYDLDAFDWGDDNFTIASWNELVIYEMHIGTFHVKGQPHRGKPGGNEEHKRQPIASGEISLLDSRFTLNRFFAFIFLTANR